MALATITEGIVWFFSYLEITRLSTPIASKEGVTFYKYAGNISVVAESSSGAQNIGRLGTAMKNGTNNLIRQTQRVKSNFINHWKSFGRQFMPKRK